MTTQLPSERPTAQGTQRFLEQLFDQLPPRSKRCLVVFKIDLAPDHVQPTPARWLAALVVANASSLISDAILVAIGTTIFPSTRDFPHFQLTDYGKLTLIGVSIACLAWPFVTRISSRPRWLFIRAAVLVTLLLWLPDLWILVHGEPIRGAGVLMLMHLSIAFITYNTLVRVAPVGPSIGSPGQRVRFQPPRPGPSGDLDRLQEI
jgi:hypothetical protein